MIYYSVYFDFAHMVLDTIENNIWILASFWPFLNLCLLSRCGESDYFFRLW